MNTRYDIPTLPLSYDLETKEILKQLLKQLDLLREFPN